MKRIDDVVGELKGEVSQWEEGIFDWACGLAQALAKVVLERVDEALRKGRGEGLGVVGFPVLHPPLPLLLVLLASAACRVYPYRNMPQSPSLPRSAYTSHGRLRPLRRSASSGAVDIGDEAYRQLP